MVLISANVAAEEAELARVIGVREVLLKPYSLAALSEVLARVLSAAPAG